MILNLLFSGIYGLDKFQRGNEFEKDNAKLQAKSVLLSVISILLYTYSYYHINKFTSMVENDDNNNKAKYDKYYSNFE